MYPEPCRRTFWRVRIEDAAKVDHAFGLYRLVLNRLDDGVAGAARRDRFEIGDFPGRIAAGHSVPPQRARANLSTSRKPIPRSRSVGRAAIASRDRRSSSRMRTPAKSPPYSATRRQAHPAGLIGKFQICLARLRRLLHPRPNQHDRASVSESGTDGPFGPPDVVSLTRPDGRIRIVL